MKNYREWLDSYLTERDINYLIENINKKTKIIFCLHCHKDLLETHSDDYRKFYTYLKSEYDKTPIKELDIEFEFNLREQKINDYLLLLFDVNA